MALEKFNKRGQRIKATVARLRNTHHVSLDDIVLKFLLLLITLLLIAKNLFTQEELRFAFGYEDDGPESADIIQSTPPLDFL